MVASADLFTLQKMDQSYWEGWSGVLFSIGAVCVFLLGWASQTLYDAFTEELYEDGLPEPGPPSPIKAPIWAWRRKSEAEAELQSNIWVRLFEPELAFQAGRAQLAPFCLGLSLVSLGAAKLMGLGAFNAALVGMRAFSGGSALPRTLAT